MIPPGPAPEPPPTAPTPVVPVADNAGPVWRTVAHLIAWVGVVNGGCTLLTYLMSTVDGFARGSTVFGPTFRAARLSDALSGVYGMTIRALALILVIGSIGVIARRRWGPVLLAVYAVGSLPNAALYVAWISTHFYRSPPSNLAYPVAVAIAGIDAVRSLTFPALLLFVLRAHRKHAANTALDAAFEPLPAVPVQP